MMLSCDRHDCAHVRRLSIKMNRNDADGGRCDLSFDFNGINRKGFFICVAEHDPAASLRYCLGCRYPGMCRGNYFVPRPETKPPKCDVDCVGPVRTRDATLYTKCSRPRLLESVHVSAANVSRLSNHFGNGVVNLVFDRQVLRVQINEGDLHGDRNQNSEFGSQAE